MGNPLYNSTMNKQGMQINNNPISMFMNRMNEFKKFSQSMNPTDAEAMVKEMLANGTMSKEQFSQFSNMAKQFQQMIGVYGQNSK